MKKVVAVGGAGDMARVALRHLAGMREDCRFTVADLDLDAARREAERLGGADARALDIFDPGALRKAIEGAELVMNCAGPYYRTGPPVLEACLDTGADYIDMGDDDEAASMLLGMDFAAREKGVTALICCGIAPGMVNVMARACAEQLDEVESVEIAWVTGHTPPDEDSRGGAAVIEHMLHCCTGECVTVREGGRVRIPAFALDHTLDFPEPLGRYRVYELGHAETATIPRFMPGVKTVRTMGSLHPPYLNGVFRGIARLIDSGRLKMREAVEFLVGLDTGGAGFDPLPYAGVLGGVLGQLLKKEISSSDLYEFLRVAAGRPMGESIGGIMVNVGGRKDGEDCTCVFSRAQRQGAGNGSMEMDEATGGCLAVFSSILLDGEIRDNGVLAPEACVDPGSFAERLRRILPGADVGVIHWLSCGRASARTGPFHSRAL